MPAFLSLLARHGTALLAASIFAGLALPDLAALLRPAVTPAVALLMTLVLMRLDLARSLAWLQRSLLVLGLGAWLLVACPVITFALVRLAGLTGPLGDGVVLAAAACTAVSAPALARLLQLDPELSLLLTVVTTAALPLTAPPLALGLLGLDLAISWQALMLRLGLMVGLPGMAALLLRRLVGPARLAAGAPLLDGTVVLVMMLFGIGIMAGLQARLLDDPAWVLGGMALAMAGNLGLNALTVLALWPLGARVALPTGMLAGLRNQALFLAVLPADSDAQLLMFFALAQVPMFVTPFLLRRVYGWCRVA